MRAYYESEGLASSLGKFEIEERPGKSRRQDGPGVGVPMPPRLDTDNGGFAQERVYIHVLRLVALAVDAEFQAAAKGIVEECKGEFKPTAIKGHARMKNKCAAKDDHRNEKKPRPALNIDINRNACTFETVADVKAAVAGLRKRFGDPARVKNMFAFDEKRAAVQFHCELLQMRPACARRRPTVA
jgi:hypothetical protein